MTITFSDGILHEVTESLADDHDLWAKHFLAAFEKMIQNGYDQVLDNTYKTQTNKIHKKGKTQNKSVLLLKRYGYKKVIKTKMTIIG